MVGIKMNMIDKVEAAVRKEFWENNGSYRDVAKAVIEAMREPTEEMIVKVPIGYCTASEVWSKMIDVALKNA